GHQHHGDRDADRRYRWSDLPAVHRLHRGRDHRPDGRPPDRPDRGGRRPALEDRQDPRLGRPRPVGARHPRLRADLHRRGGERLERVPRRDAAGAPPGTAWSRAVVFAAFLAVHGLSTWMAVTNPGVGYGDVGLYQWWAWDAL